MMFIKKKFFSELILSFNSARAALMGYKHDCEVQDFYNSYLAKEETILSKYFEKTKTLPKNILCGKSRFMVQELPNEILIIFPGTRQELAGFYVDAHADFDIPLKGGFK